MQQGWEEGWGRGGAAEDAIAYRGRDGADGRAELKTAEEDVGG